MFECCARTLEDCVKLKKVNWLAYRRRVNIELPNSINLTNIEEINEVLPKLVNAIQLARDSNNTTPCIRAYMYRFPEGLVRSSQHFNTGITHWQIRVHEHNDFIPEQLLNFLQII